ncbi:MAG: hypothetical protein IRZ32_00640 [Solirubrobacteraceae bacterium]|nr:hypothetical protein [Solirubrobacteraceae bacterium]
MDVRTCSVAALAAAALALPSAAQAAPTGGASFAAEDPVPAATGGADPSAPVPAADPASAVATILPDGTAVAPAGAPPEVAAIIAAGNEIATLPYRWGGGHARWRDRGYDCSGSVSFALRGAGLLDRPLASGDLMAWGRPGRGRWVTVYAHRSHVFMVVAGLRFDTSGQRAAGTRWQPMDRSTKGFAVRHPAGL